MASLSDSVGASVEHNGFMMKRGEHGLQLYRRRYFMLRDDELFYMLDESLESKLNPIGKVDLREVTRIESVLNVTSLFGSVEHHLYLRTARRLYDLSVSDHADAVRWLERLNEAHALAQRRKAATASSAPPPADALAPWLDGKEPDLAALLPPVSKLALPPAASPERVPSPTAHAYEAVPAEVLKVFRFTDGYALEHFTALLDAPIADAAAHATRAGHDAACAVLFAGALLVRALGADALQFNDAVPRTAPLAAPVAREYATMHDVLMTFLQARAARLAADTAVLDRWVMTQRQPLLFGEAAQFEVAALDRIGLLRWHLLSLCQFASTRLEPLRHRSGACDSALEGVLYAWDLMTDRLLSEVSRLPMTTVGTHLWSVLVESDEYRRDAADSDRTPTDDDNPYEVQLRRARERVGAPLQNAIAARLPRCDDATQDTIQRLLHADVLMRQLIDELDALGMFDDLARLLKLFTAAALALTAAVDALTPLKAYRSIMREQRTKLLAAWWQSAHACGGASLLLERAAAKRDSRPVASPRTANAAAAQRKWFDVLLRSTALLKRIASLVDSRQFSDARDAVLLCAIEVQGTLPPLANLRATAPLAFH